MDARRKTRANAHRLTQTQSPRLQITAHTHYGYGCHISPARSPNTLVRVVFAACLPSEAIS